jgi:quinol monooxygenase YgiN
VIASSSRCPSPTCGGESPTCCALPRIFLGPHAFPNIKLLWLRVLRLPDLRSGFGTLFAHSNHADCLQQKRQAFAIIGANMVIAIVHIRASSKKIWRIAQGTVSLSGPTEAEAGCKSCQLYQDTSDANVLRIETRWITQGDLLRHIRSDTYKRFLLLMELGSEKPTIEFYTVSELRGVDLIREARAQCGRKALT